MRMDDPDSNADEDPFAMRHDPIEDEPALGPVLAEAEELARVALGPEREGELGYCHALWAEKARILRERFGVTWRSPAEMNPHVLFD